MRVRFTQVYSEALKHKTRHSAHKRGALRLTGREEVQCSDTVQCTLMSRFAGGLSTQDLQVQHRWIEHRWIEHSRFAGGLSTQDLQVD